MHQSRPLLTAVALALLAAGAAHAQLADAAGLREAEDESMIVVPLAHSVEEIEDMEIIGSGGEEIGEVEEVLVDLNGIPVAVAAEVGGFLGIGEREVVITLEQLRRTDDGLVTTLSREQLEGLPEWED